MIAGCGIGVVDECVKTLLPGREFSTGDLVRDFVGVVVAVVVSITVGKIKKVRRSDECQIESYT